MKNRNRFWVKLKFILGVAQQLGDHCSEDSECQVKFPNATCSAKKICECRENYHVAEDHCWKNIGKEKLYLFVVISEKYW